MGFAISQCVDGSKKNLAKQIENQFEVVEGITMDGIWLVVLLVLGFSMLFKPEVLWKIENIFSVKTENQRIYI